MNDWIQQTDAQSFYLVYQFIASLILALVGILIGLLPAWILWGRSGPRLRRARTDVGQLREEWEKLMPKNEVDEPPHVSEL